MTLLTQREIEEQMYYGGIKRADGMMEKAEAGKRASDLPYAKEVFREFVLPVAEAIKANVESGKAGKRQAHANLLHGLDYEAVAFLSVRTALSTQLSTDPENHRQLAYSMGRTIHQELLLAQVEDFSPELYHTLVRDMGRRLSKSASYRTTVMRLQAQKAGIVFTEWPIGAREQVGFFLLELLETAGLIVLGNEIRSGYKRVAREVMIHPDVLERINGIKDYLAISMPVFGPCVEPPIDWTTPMDGGFHTNALRRANRNLVHGTASVLEVARHADMPIVLQAVNALQRTKWAVNTRMLDTLYEVAKNFSMKEIVSLADKPKPVPPVWLDKGMKVEDMTQPQQDMFKNWKRSVADWHTERKLLATRAGRFYAATRQAEMFRDYPAIYFVYFADSRGRLYPMTYGLNPQGSDLGKSLLHFADGLPVNTNDAIRWFHVQGANKWGFDKATLADRHAWVVQRQEEFLSYAADPINNRGWAEASKPLQFLAWCYEYRDYVLDTDGTFVSHLPISMDGSCNGLQNLSALLRDEIGGKATNLTANEVMEDIYRRVAEAAVHRLTAMALDGDDAKLRDLWLEHGISRAVVKRSVMTTPYGVTLMTATEYVVKDYLDDPDVVHPFGKDTKVKKAAARVLMKAVWPAIGDVVVKGREAMDWLKKGARAIVNNFNPELDPIIRWDTPSGFPACQAYFEEHVHRINTRLHGPVKIRVLSETDEPSMSRHSGGMAPNFVHSMDAAHLHLTTAAASVLSIDALAMIHDDYGTHAANSQRLYEIIRRQFVAMYDNNDPIADLCVRYSCLPKPPAKGTLDIREVLKSDFFFS
jgi:DNA-directed RNA polymerase